MSNLENLPCSFPASNIPADVDVEAVLTAFNGTLGPITSSSFTSDAVWRDILGLSGTFATTYGADNIVTEWNKLWKDENHLELNYLAKSGRLVQLGVTSWVEGEFSFTINSSPKRTCIAGLSVVPAEGGQWKIWVLRTFIDQLQNQPNVDTLLPSIHAGEHENHKSTDSRDQKVFECVVIGGGQAGLSVAGRLQALGVDYVLIEKNGFVGDSWKSRYKSTKLHTSRESSHLPFDRTFPASYPEYLSKDDLARGYADWAKKYDIRIWLSTTLKSGKWDDSRKVWELEIATGSEELTTIRATHVIMAIGAGCSIPTMPTYPGAENFKGTILHSADYVSASEWVGKNGIVVGTANTGHDVAEDMVDAGLSSVTMIQRSPTYVLPTEYYAQVQQMTYNANIPTEYADQMSLTAPIGVVRLISLLVLHSMAEAEPERFDNLEKVGFKVVRKGDLIYQVFDRFGGHYIDVGASAKISNGLIKMKSDSLPTQYTADGLLFSDGSELKADVVVFATGFVGNMKVGIEELFGPEVASRIENFWGIDEQGEIKGAYKALEQPNLWMHGGTCIHARYMSRYVALQIRAALDGTPFTSTT